MFLLEYDELGDLEQITPDAPYGLIGAYVDKLPVTIEVMLESGVVEELTNENNIKYYKIKGENE